MGDRYNSILVGILTGLVVPFVGFAVLLLVYEQLDQAGWLSSEGFSISFRRRTLVVIAICLNIIPLRIFQNRRANDSLRGLVGMTVLLVVAWFVYYGGEILN